MVEEKLEEILEKHKKWLNDEEDGERANLRDSDLRYNDLRYSNLSGVKGLLSPIDYLQKNFEKTKDGYICYKTFNCDYSIPNYWKIKKGSIISEVVNPCRTKDCACGVNVGTLDWVKNNNNNNTDIWECLIKWEWLPGVVVPYNTSGKIRCEKIKLLEVYKEERESEYRNGKSGKKL